MITDKQRRDFENKSRDIRRYVWEIVFKTGKGHVGGTFSIVEVLVLLYYYILDMEKISKYDAERDRVLIGKGHACLAVYYILNDLQKFAPQDWLIGSFGTNNDTLGGQLNTYYTGVEYNTGSLGHVLGIGAGFALNAKLSEKSYMTYVILGDGECDEGSIWEAAKFSVERKLNNLVALVDCNGLSVLGNVQLSSIGDRFGSLGWDVLICDGHDFASIYSALNRCGESDKPSVVLLKTVKGKGMSFIENNSWNHQTPISEDQYESGILELNQSWI